MVNDFQHISFRSDSQGFGEDFKQHLEQANRHVLLNYVGIFSFWNQGDNTISSETVWPASSETA
jgi:hypothetical protein